MSFTVIPARKFHRSTHALEAWSNGESFLDANQHSMVSKNSLTEDELGGPGGKLFVRLSPHHAFHISSPLGEPYIKLPSGVKRFVFSRQELEKLNYEALLREEERIALLYEDENA